MPVQMATVISSAVGDIIAHDISKLLHGHDDELKEQSTIYYHHRRSCVPICVVFGKADKHSAACIQQIIAHMA
jgi:hypothetical protein